MAQWWACRTWRLWVPDPVEAKFLSGVFSTITSAEACEKGSRWLWKETCVSTGVRKPGNMCVTDRHDMTLAVKVALKPNATNQPPTSENNREYQTLRKLTQIHASHYAQSSLCTWTLVFFFLFLLTSFFKPLYVSRDLHHFPTKQLIILKTVSFSNTSTFWQICHWD